MGWVADGPQPGKEVMPRKIVLDIDAMQAKLDELYKPKGRGKNRTRQSWSAAFEKAVADNDVWEVRFTRQVRESGIGGGKVVKRGTRGVAFRTDECLLDGGYAVIDPDSGLHVVNLYQGDAGGPDRQVDTAPVEWTHFPTV